MLLVVVTPNIHVAFTLRSSFYSIVNLFAGYVMPKPVSLSYLIVSKARLERFQKPSRYEIFEGSVDAEHSEMVDLDVLLESDVMGFEWIAHIAVWRYGERDISIRREEKSFRFLGRLLWL